MNHALHTLRGTAVSLLCLGIVAGFGPGLCAGEPPAAGPETVRLEPTRFTSFAELYAQVESGGEGLFVTSDLALDTVRRFTEAWIRWTEKESILPRMRVLLDTLGTGAVAALGEGHAGDEAARAAELAAGYVTVARALFTGTPDLEGLPAGLVSRVQAELALVDKHAGMDFSPLFGHKEDYSQYVPRGPYTRSEELERYFRAMMWLGRRMFRVEEVRPEGAGLPADRPNLKGWHAAGPEGFPEEGRIEARALLLLTELLGMDKNARKAHRDITLLLAALFGPPDDLTPADVKSLRADAGLPVRAWRNAADAQVAAWAGLAARSAQERGVIDGTGMGRLGFVLFGQHTAFDAKAFQRLVYHEHWPLVYTGPADREPFSLNREDARGPVRGFPLGLDLMAVLGSEEALDLLEADHETAYSGYMDALAALRREFQELLALPVAETREGASPVVGGLNFQILRAAAALLEAAPEGSPPYLHAPAWKRKQLAAALGAWTALRHDTVLYAKQSYSSATRGILIARPGTVRVEAVPAVFERLSTLLETLSGRLRPLSPLPEEVEQKVMDMTAWLNDLEMAAGLELEGKAFPEELAGRLRMPAAKVRGLLRFSDAFADAIGGQPDLTLPLAADVHTCMPFVVEEALGNPLLLTVMAPAPEGPVPCRGGAFSYYEFKQPMTDRLTDEAWRARAGAPDAPAPPAWLGERISKGNL